MSRAAILALMVAAPAALLAAAPPSALAKVAAGMWEIDRVSGSQPAVRECVSDILSLAQFEHRGRNCSRSIVSDSGNSTLVKYSCGGAGFGRSQIDVVTPRSLTISTQGISDQLPFNYVLVARRVGDCEKSTSSSRH